MHEELKSIIDESLSHISADVASIAKRELIYKLTNYINYISKDLNHFKDSHIGLWATDIEPKDKELFFQIK